jgi:hypothetical protein
MGIEPTSEAWEGTAPKPFSMRRFLVFRRKAHLLVHSSEYGLRIAWARFVKFLWLCLRPSGLLTSESTSTECDRIGLDDFLAR